MFPTGSIQTYKCAGCGAIVGQSDMHFCTATPNFIPSQFVNYQDPVMLRIALTLERIEVLLKEKGESHE
jgi:hypothetical protein